MSESSSVHLAERVIVVTGAAGGFGLLIAERAAERGAAVVGADVDEAALAAAFTPLLARGMRVAYRAADVTDLDDMTALAAFAVDAFGRVDVIVNNAGTMPLGFFADHERAADAWAQAIDVNVKGVLNGIAAVYDHMMAQGRGHVVNISSTYGNAGTEGSGVYSATKSAVNILSESLRVEAQGKIKVSVVRPTGVPTTGLGKSIVNPRAVIGMTGHHAADANTKMQQLFAGELPATHTDPDSIRYFALDAEHVAEVVLYVIDQPWGVSISDITVRASGEPYLL
jgi:NADP-dependent 3-hydroxy acid dehydrogenase YdfG